MDGKLPSNTAALRVAKTEVPEQIHFLWLEITGKCQRECEHCYAASGPKGNHGTMAEADWKRVIDEGAAGGVVTVQFIGGEPTLNPALPSLVRHALSRGIKVEVFSNLERIKPELWDVFSQEGVRLATSYYSASSTEHDAIVKRRGSYDRTKQNIREAIGRGIPLRVGVIGVRERQDVDGAIHELQEMGVSTESIGVDYLRQVGRGVRDQEPGVEQLCGNCTNGVLAILPDGSVQPCVFSRWPEFTVGNAQEQPFGDILEGSKLHEVRTSLNVAFSERQSALAQEMEAWQPPPCPPVQQPCQPQCLPSCFPGCNPSCGPACSPACIPARNCKPVVG